MFSRARWRLTFWFAGTFALILVLIGAAVLVTARTTLLDQVKDDLRIRSERLLRPVAPGRTIFDPDRNGVIQFATAGGYFYSIIGPEGAVFSASEGAQSARLPELEDLEEKTAEGPAFISAESTDGEQLRIYVQPVTSVRGETFYFTVGRSIEPELSALRQLLLILLAGGLIGMGLAGAAGYWLAGRALRPIQTAMDAQRTFVADASHELRTPLSLIRANAELMQRHPDDSANQESLEDIIKETDRLSYLVGQMLTLARADSAGADLERQHVDMAALATETAKEMRLIAAGKNIEVTARTHGHAMVEGDPQRLGELLLILLDNAIKYTEPGGTVNVSAGATGRNVEVTVSDNGRGIPEDALPHVFDRFYRVDKARSREMGGTGLGLPIARWIVESHGGTIGIASEPGAGTTVTVNLPLLPDEPAPNTLQAKPESPEAAQAEG